MSLKAFHVLFVAISTLLCLGVGGWALREYTRSRSTGMLLYAAGSLMVSVALVVYGRWFLKKLKNESYL